MQKENVHKKEVSLRTSAAAVVCNDIFLLDVLYDIGSFCNSPRFPFVLQFPVAGLKVHNILHGIAGKESRNILTGDIDDPLVGLLEVVLTGNMGRK